MRRLPALVLALVGAVVVTVITAGGIVWVIQAADPHPRSGTGMMATDSSSAPDSWNKSWRLGVMGMTGSVDVSSEPEYLAEMVAHHQEAIVAAGELARSDRAGMRAFGESIVTTQSAQVQTMQAWLRKWYPEHSPSLHYRPMMRDLSGLSGDRLDLAFLQDMLGHHMVAVMMSQHLLARGAADHDQVADLARTIRDEQHAEIVQMRTWLAWWSGTDWRGGMGGGMGCGTRFGHGLGMAGGPGR